MFAFILTSLLSLPSSESQVSVEPQVIEEMRGKVRFDRMVDNDKGVWGTPRIAYTKGRLLVTRNNPNRIQIFETDTLKELYNFTGIPGVAEAKAEPSGWAAVCTGQPSGGRLILLNLLKPLETFFPISFDTDFKVDCMAMDFEKRDDREQPYLWMSTSERNIILMDPYSKDVSRYEKEDQEYAPRILKTFEPISGVPALQLFGDKIFAVNGIHYASSLPLILSRDSGEIVMGNAWNDPAKSLLTKTFSEGFLIAPDWNTVTYLNSEPSQLVSFNLNDLSEKSAKTYDAGVKTPLRISRYGDCSVVLGMRETGKPQWIVYKGSDFKIVRRFTQTEEESFLNSSTIQTIDEKGNLYTAQTRGVTRIAGLFDGLQCVAQ